MVTRMVNASSAVQRLRPHDDAFGLVDHRSLSPGPHSGFPQRALGTHSGQAFVGQSHRNGYDAPSQLLGDRDGVFRGRTGPIGERARQPDHHFHHL